MAVAHPFSPNYNGPPLRRRKLRDGRVVWGMSRKARGALTAHYFVDEAGDGTLFSRGGKSIIGTDGCSKFFALGMAWVYEPPTLAQELADLRATLLADPYFRRVPSMQPAGRKTALYFHAKDDLPEVRREVFRVLQRHPMEFYAAVFDKQTVLANVRRRNAQSADYKYHPNELYDLLVSRLFTGRLHCDGGYELVFAERGRADRTGALEKALRNSQDQFENKTGVRGRGAIVISPSTPMRTPCLQATDYLLWAVQRCFERGEDRYIDYVGPTVRFVIDCDDVRAKGYGQYYTVENVLNSAALAGRVRR